MGLRSRRRTALTVSIAAALCAGAASATTDSYPPPLRSCGSIQHGTKRLAVDIAEAGGGATVSCVIARGAMSRYLEKAGARRWPVDSGRNLNFVYARVLFSCYTSRPDRVGWDFHCSPEYRNRPARFVDVAAGRRGHLCHLADTRHCPPG